jgi:transposase-like protein
MEQLFARRHFDREVIILCVRWYLRYKLSFRDLVEMMAERGLHLAHTTILRRSMAMQRHIGQSVSSARTVRCRSEQSCDPRSIRTT